MSKILIIDDEVQIRSLLARMLGLEGYEVCQAGDCKAAIRQLEIQQPDVALCDVFLPDGNGVDLVLNIKKTAPNVEVILLTAHGHRRFSALGQGDCYTAYSTPCCTVHSGFPLPPTARCSSSPNSNCRRLCSTNTHRGWGLWGYAR